MKFKLKIYFTLMLLNFTLGEAFSKNALQQVDSSQSHPDESALIYGVKEKSITTVRKALADGKDPNQFSDGLSIVFYLIVDDCYPHILQELVDSGLDVNVFSKSDGSYPIHWAAAHEDLSCFEILVDNGANLHVSDNNQRNIYFFVLQGRNKKILDFLYQKNVDFMQKNIFGIDPVHYSILVGQPNFFKELIAKEIEKNLSRDREQQNIGELNSKRVFR
ncbi:ankyrin repeat domain-containing protein [Ningiella sp. W23]|uniref:ankyrin repeat domain-containing protein n=1 Tax=Ningiella sp. W23 TaxID=3023715 RepID=UPI0037564EDC